MAGFQLEDCLAADVFGLTYREFAAAKPTDYRWNLLAPAAIATLRRAVAELWSLEKLADHLHSNLDDTRAHWRRFVMSEKVNAGKNGGERISLLLQEWLDRFEPDADQRKILARDLSRLLASQMQWADQAGETLTSLGKVLEGSDSPSVSEPSERPEPPRAWGPQWKD